MGLRFRKSIQLAPGVKMNVGKKSVGVSVGGKLGGVSFNSKTGAHARASMPGTGISYTTNLGSNNKKASGTSSPDSQVKKQKPPKKPFYKRGWFIALMALTVIGAVASPDSESDSPENPDVSIVDTVTPSSTQEPDVDPQSEPTQVADIGSDSDTTLDSTPEIKPELKPDTVPEVKPEPKPDAVPEVKPEPKPDLVPEVKPESKPGPTPEVKPEFKPKPAPEVKPEPKPDPVPEAKPEPTPVPAEITNERTVYVTPTGKRYHYDSSCGRGTYSPTTLENAQAMGLTPCKKCAGG